MPASFARRRVAMNDLIILHLRDTQLVHIAVNELIRLFLSDKPALFEFAADVLPQNLPIPDMARGKHDRAPLRQDFAHAFEMSRRMCRNYDLPECPRRIDNIKRIARDIAVDPANDRLSHRG